MCLAPEEISNFTPHHPFVDLHLERLNPGQIGRLREGCVRFGIIQPLFQTVEQVVKSGVEGVVLFLIAATTDIHEQVVVRRPVGDDLLLLQDIQAH